jgi:FtsZ-interacting cell division protein ZipA
MTSTTAASASAAPFGPTPNLTDHFKQALNMTRNQFQSGSNPLGASTQMGINAPQLSNFGAPQSGTMSAPTMDGNFDMSLIHNQQWIGWAGWIKSNSKWIIVISLIIIVGLSCYFFWLKYRKSSEFFTQRQSTMTPRQSMQQGEFTDGNNQRFVNMNTQRQQQQHPQQQQQQQQQQQKTFAQQQTFPQSQKIPQSFSSMDEKQDNIRGNEQQMSQRGAEFANPSFISQMMPVSTRISSPQSQPQAQSYAQAPQQTQPQSYAQAPQQTQPQSYAQAPQQTQPQSYAQAPQQTQTLTSMQIPISQPQAPQTQTLTSMQIPISQQAPVQSAIPPPPIVPITAPVSDPNFTAL